MVFSYFRDLVNYYLGNRYPKRELVATLTERDEPASTMLVKYSFKGVGSFAPIHPNPSIIRQPILRPLEEEEHEAWVETHPSQSVCIKRLQIHEEF